jgi:5-methylcytosine-specific restriction endonuclease McrA
MAKINIEKTIKEIIDYLAPLQFPYEQSVYNYLFRWSYLETGRKYCRKGKRTIAAEIGEAKRSKRKAKISYHAICENIDSLAKKGHIKVGDVTRDGTLYTVLLPKEIDGCIELMRKKKVAKSNNVDYFNNPDKRLEIFKRDNWQCYYCEEKVNRNNATLDHIKPLSKGGNNSKENLVTCCLECNAIKSGRTPMEPDALLLKRYKEKLKRQ